MGNILYSWHVLAVTNLKVSRSYFVEKLGFKELRNVPGKSFLQLGECRVIIGDCPDSAAARTLGDHSYFAYIFCQNIDAIYQGMVERGAIISGKIEDKPWGMREFNLETPDGHRMVFGSEVQTED